MPAYEALAGGTAAIDWLASLAPADAGSRPEHLETTFRALYERGEQLVGQLWEGLTRLPGVHLFGPPPGKPRTPTVAFTVESISSADLAGRLAAEHGVFLSHGHFYAPDTIQDLAVPDATGLVRAGCACYTTDDEVDQLLIGVRDIIRR